MDELPPFTLEERDRRWSLLHDLMGRHEVDFLLVFPRWMEGDALFVANQPGAIVFPRAGEPILIARGGPSPNGWIGQVRPATASGTPAVAFGAAAAAALRDVGADGQRIAVAGLSGASYTLVRNPEGYVNYTSLMAVREALPQATIVDGTPILNEARYVKSEAEIEILRRSVEIGEACVEVMCREAAPGKTASSVYAEMTAEQMRHGAGGHIAWGGGPWGSTVRRYVDPPDGVLDEGWCLRCEAEPSVRGYTAQVTQPVFVRSIPSEAHELFELGSSAFDLARQLMRPGVRWREVFGPVQALSTATHKVEFLIHGRGLGDEGAMFIPTDNHEDNPLADDTVRANTAFILKPYAYLAGTPRNDWANAKNVTWGDTVVVRPDGAERLGRRPQTLLSTR